jgi:hypothetical protein
MPMGNQAPSAALSICISQIFDFKYAKKFMVFADDILCASRDFESHYLHMDAFLARSQIAGFKIQGKKSFLFCKRVKFLGMIISKMGMQPDPARIEAIKNVKPPGNVTELRRYLGIMGFNRRFIKGYADIARPLCQALRGNPEKLDRIKWTDECQVAYD